MVCIRPEQIKVLFSVNKLKYLQTSENKCLISLFLPASITKALFMPNISKYFSQNGPLK